jgi:DNA polymerase
VPVLLDVESRSRADLKRIGGRNYWEHESTEPLCVVGYDTDSGDLDVWTPGQPWPWLDSRAIVAAHNAMGFDRFALARICHVPVEHFADMIDTAELARRAGLPGALDALGTRWLDLPKDKVASAYTKKLSRPSRAAKTRGQLPEITADVLERVVAYCVSDVEIMAHGWELLEPWLEFEPDVCRADRAVNDRGIAFDSQLARRLLECDARNAEAALETAARALGMTAADVEAMARSPQQFVAFTGAENAQAETLAQIVRANEPHGTNARAVWLCKARQALASIARGKLEAGLARVSADGRLRDMHKYLGAHTWRWSGKGMQLQNIPRPSKRFEEWGDDQICALADAVLAGRHWADQDEIDLLLRATLHARPGHMLATCDFSGVEARGLAWVAGDAAALDTLASGRDAYKVAAAAIFGVSYEDVTKVQRQAGKVAELACGYGGGVGALENMARGIGFDFAAAGVEPAEIVAAWRALHWPVVEFWRELERAFASAVRGTEASASVFTCTPSEDGTGVAIWLPSGRPIVYNETRYASRNGRPALAFLGTKNFVEHTYGGKLTENVIQALCRDLLAEVLVKTEDAGLAPVLHVHDEAVCEIPANAGAEGLEYLTEIMHDLPEWAHGFPVGAQGHLGRRYRK